MNVKFYPNKDVGIRLSMDSYDMTSQHPLHSKSDFPLIFSTYFFAEDIALSVKSHLTYRASVRPENALTYSAGNKGQNFCGVFSENAPLLRSSGVAVVFHTFRWPFFFIAKWYACVLVFTVKP